MPLYAARGAVPVQFVRVRQLVRILGKKAPHARPYLFYRQPAQCHILKNACDLIGYVKQAEKLRYAYCLKV